MNSNIIITGDMYLGNRSIIIDENIKNELENSDLIISNFENVLENNNLRERHDKGSILTFNKEVFDDLINNIKAGKLLLLGNNHIHDLNKEGLIQTKEFFKKYININSTGAGYYKELLIPFIFEHQNKKIALLNVCSSLPEVMGIEATDKFPGILDHDDQVIFEILKKYNKKIDYFIIIAHWGKEYVNIPSYRLRRLAYRWIDHGADIVIGHHPHVIQGKEIYNNKYIYYSLGNFIFPDFQTKTGFLKKWKPINKHSVLLKLNFQENITIEETGLFFDTNENKLKKSKKSLDILEKSSLYLNYNNYNKKSYYKSWELVLYNNLRKNHGFKKVIRTIINKIKKSI